MPAMVTILLAGAHANVRGSDCSIFVRISEWVAGDVRSKRHVCHHVYPGRDMIKTMTNYFDICVVLSGPGPQRMGLFYFI